MRRPLARAQLGLASDVSKETQFSIGLTGLAVDSFEIAAKTWSS